MGDELPRAHLELLLLGALASRPLHGYAIIERVREKSGGVFDLREGSVYPALHRLEGAGWVSSEWREVAARRRRVYRLTDVGRGRLSGERAAWARFVEAVQSVVGPSRRA